MDVALFLGCPLRRITSRSQKHIHHEIKSNALFSVCLEDGLVELIDAFELKEFNTGFNNNIDNMTLATHVSGICYFILMMMIIIVQIHVLIG